MLCLWLFMMAIGLQSQPVLVQQDAFWKYLDNGSDQGSAWLMPAFDDALWATGQAQLGYGDGDETTLIDFGPDPLDKYICTYFRHAFEASFNEFSPFLLLQLLVDDGAVVYLNGTEIVRYNMPNNAITYLSPALSPVSGSAEDHYLDFIIPSDQLLEGTNIVAVEVHQSSSRSSDVSFNFALSFTNTQPSLIRKEPYIIFTTQKDEMELLWQLHQTDSCTIEWGMDQSYSLGSSLTYEYGNDHQHRYTVEGLTPETIYYYRMFVGKDTVAGRFRSAPEPSKKELTFLAYGDSRSQPEHHDDVAKQIVAEVLNDENALSFLIFSGDFVNNGNLEQDWDHQFFSSEFVHIRQMMQQLPYLGTLGNHEGNGLLFGKYFPYPVYSGENYYWSFDYGPAHFSIIDQFAPYTVGSPQYQWLADDLAQTSKPWKFILLHAPGWTAGGGHQNDETVQEVIQPLCVENGVQFVIGGHNHYYACAVVDKVVHITTGGGGAPLYNPHPDYPNIVKVEKAHHFCKFVMDTASLQFIAINDSGRIIHEFNYHELVAGTTESPLSIDDVVLAPNPFNQSTALSFFVKEKNRVKISIYNSASTLIRILADQEMAEGKQRYAWDGTDMTGKKVQNGAYYITIESGHANQPARKLIRLNL